MWSTSAAVVFGVALLVATPEAADLQGRTVAAFDRYVRLTEARMHDETAGRRPFLWIDSLPEERRAAEYAKVRRGEIAVSRLETRDQGKSVDIADGLCHHWVGTVLAPGAKLDAIVALMQSYDRYQHIYRPAVRRSRTVARNGDHFNAFLQLYMKKVISVVLNTENDVRYERLSPIRVFVRSYSTRIAEVADPDTPQEREKPVGHDNGFLWRFNNYCSLDERGEGTYVQCESVSLSRSIPTGLGWLIGPFVRSIPRESLEFTLGTIRSSTARM